MQAACTHAAGVHCKLSEQRHTGARLETANTLLCAVLPSSSAGDSGALCVALALASSSHGGAWSERPAGPVATGALAPAANATERSDPEGEESSIESSPAALLRGVLAAVVWAVLCEEPRVLLVLTPLVRTRNRDRAAEAAPGDAFPADCGRSPVPDACT